MIEEKWLSDVVFTTVQSKANITRIKKTVTGDFQVGDLSKAVNTARTNDVTVQAWLSRCNDRKSTLVFCVDIAHLQGLTYEFRKHGIDARLITGETPLLTRSQRLDAFRNGEYPILLNCGVFTEGTDIPNIDCVLLARPTRSRNLLVQMIGRGMRLHPGKANCHIIDMVASLEAGIVTTPTLFGLDPACIINEADIDEMKRLRDEPKLQDDSMPYTQTNVTSESTQPPATLTFTHYDSVWDLINDTSGERHIRGMSPLAWVQVDGDRYILSSRERGHLTIVKTSDKQSLFQVLYTRKLPPDRAEEPSPNEINNKSKRFRSPYGRPQEIATANTLSEAVRAADTFAQERFVWKTVLASASWRSSPASEGQLMFLNDFRNQDNQLNAETLTKGKAGDMITKIKFGARRRLKKYENEKRDGQRKHLQKEKEQRLRERERVGVGPINNHAWKLARKLEF